MRQLDAVEEILGERTSLLLRELHGFVADLAKGKAHALSLHAGGASATTPPQTRP